MILWLDVQLPPSLGRWLRDNLALDAYSLKELGLRDATDAEIFAAAKKIEAVLVSKDSDFVDLVQRQGAPPQLVWLTCGNLTNARLKVLFARAWPETAAVLATGESIVELGD
jgi:predicted nuclease of predicted toxin-antitoxin system